jgi:hypothetical protein
MKCVQSLIILRFAAVLILLAFLGSPHFEPVLADSIGYCEEAEDWGCVTSEAGYEGYVCVDPEKGDCITCSWRSNSVCSWDSAGSELGRGGGELPGYWEEPPSMK